jgi:hypothetical protein
MLAERPRAYAPELYGKKSSLKLASTDPLIPDEHISITDLSANVLMDRPDAMLECFGSTTSRPDQRESTKGRLPAPVRWALFFAAFIVAAAFPGLHQRVYTSAKLAGRRPHWVGPRLHDQQPGTL